MTTNKEPLVKWGWVRAILFVAVSTGAMIPYRAVRTFLLDDHGFTELEYTLLRHALKCVTFLLVVYLLRKFVDRQSFKSLGYSFKAQFRKDFMVGLGLGVGLIALMFAVLLLSGSIAITGVQFPAYSLLLIAGVLGVVVIREEVISRGYMLISLMSSMNKYVALLISSVFFMMLHSSNASMTVLSYVNIVLAGIMIGMYYVHQKNLWFPMGIHFGWNFALGAISGSAVSGNELPSILTIERLGDDLWTGGAFGFEASILTPLLLIATTVYIHYKYSRRRITA